MLRSDEIKVKHFVDKICGLDVNDISGDAPIEVCIGDKQIWFTHTHIAEIRELYLLQKNESEIKVENSIDEQILPLQVITVGDKDFGKPSQNKVDALIAYYQKYGKLDKPIVVSRRGDKYVVEDKYLRYYVAKLLKLTNVPVYIVSQKSTNKLFENKNSPISENKISRSYRSGENLKGKKIIISFGQGREIEGVVKEDKGGAITLVPKNNNSDIPSKKYLIAPNVRSKFIRVID